MNNNRWEELDTPDTELLQKLAALSDNEWKELGGLFRKHLDAAMKDRGLELIFSAELELLLALETEWRHYSQTRPVSDTVLTTLSNLDRFTNDEDISPIPDITTV